MQTPLNVAIVSSARTPVGRALKGTLRHTRPEHLAATAMRAALARAPGLAAGDIEDVTLGCAMPEAEQGLNVARNAVFVAGFPDEVPAQTINRFCSSGAQAIVEVGLAVHAGLIEVGLAGGVESMSMVPMSGNKVSCDPYLVEHRPEAYIGMGHTAERVARAHNIGRAEQDAFAARSHRLASSARREGLFVEEIAPVAARLLNGGGEDKSVTFDADECPREDTSEEVLAKLKPAFAAKGSVTAGNASPLNDGAAALILASERAVREKKLPVVARLLAYAVVGVPPEVMGIGPVPAIQKLLRLTGLGIDDIDLFEINEAFAAQALYCQKTLGIDLDRLNVHGGGIAIGHPLGATGARIATTAIHTARRRGRDGRGRKEDGALLVVESMCIGGGMGFACLFRVPRP